MKLLPIALAFCAGTAAARVYVPPPDTEDMRQYCEPVAAGAGSISRAMHAGIDDADIRSMKVDNWSSPTERDLKEWVFKYVKAHRADGDEALYAPVFEKCMKNARNVLGDLDSNRHHALQ